jgi:outer membrane protein TolC
MVFDFGEGPVEIPGSYFFPNDSLMLTADINQSIYSFGRIKEGIRLAEENMKLSQLELDEEERSLIVNIKRAFYGYILAKEVLKVHEETLAQKEEAYEVAKARLKAGLVAEFQVLSAESDLEGFKPEIISAANEVDLALLAVKDLLNIGETGGVEIDLVGTLEPIALSYTREDTIARAMENNYFLKQYRSSIALSEFQERFKKNEKKPVIGGFASYSVNNTFDSSTGNANFTGSGAWEDLITVGVGMQIPISALFGWSMEGAESRKAELDLMQVRTGLGTLENSIRLGIDSILLRLKEEDAKIRSTKKNVELASTLYESARVQFSSGLISRLELKEVQLMLNSARLAHLLSVYNQKLAAYDLADAIGVHEFN